VAREDIELTFDKGKLSITVERKAPEDKGSHWHEERGYGKAIREVALSKSVDPDSIAAELTNGVLHVTVAKTPEAQPKKIEVK
jgi:HSP20 family protein